VRVFAYLLILVGFVFLADAAYDEHGGVADVLSPGRGSQHHVIARADDPDQFRNLMAYQWLHGPLFLFAGFIILGFCRRANRLDPFSPDFAGSDALDDLNHTLTEEEKQRHRPPK